MRLKKYNTPDITPAIPPCSIMDNPKKINQPITHHFKNFKKNLAILTIKCHKTCDAFFIGLDLCIGFFCTVRNAPPVFGEVKFDETRFLLNGFGATCGLTIPTLAADLHQGHLLISFGILWALFF